MPLGPSRDKPGPGHHRPDHQRRANRGQVRLPLVHRTQSIKDSKQLLGAGDAQNRLPAAIERTTHLGLANLTILVLWYDHAGQPATDLNTRRHEAPWYRHKRHVYIEDMITAFRRTRITDITAAPDTTTLFGPSHPTSQPIAA